MSVNLITASYDHRVVFWDLGGTARRTLQFNESQVNCLALSPDKSKLAVAGHGCIRIYDASPNASAQQTSALGVTDGSMLSGNITSIAFIDVLAVKGQKQQQGGGGGGSEDGEANKPKVKVITNEYTLLVTSEDGSIKVLSAKVNMAAAAGGHQQSGQGSSSHNQQQQHNQQPQVTFSVKHEVFTKVPITAATLFPNQQLLLTGTQLGRISVWHVPAIFGLPGGLVTAGSPAASSSIAEGNGGAEDNRAIQSASSNTPTSGATSAAPAQPPVKPMGGTKPIQELALEADPTSIRSIAISPVGNFISVATNIGRVHFFAFCRGESAMVMAKQSTRSATVTPLRALRPIRNSNPHFNQSLNPFALEEFTFTVAHEKYVLKTAIAPNCRYIVTASADYTVGMFGVPEYLASGKFICFSDIYASPPPQQVVGGEGGEANVGSGGTKELELGIGNDDPSLLQFKGGVASGVEDPRLRFPLRQTYLGHQRWVWDCCVSPCSGYILTASSDHTARLWRVDGDLNAPLPQPMTPERLASELTSPTLLPPPTVVNSSIAVYNFHNKAVNCCLLDIES